MKAPVAFLNVFKVNMSGTRAMSNDIILVSLLSFCHFACYRFFVLSFVVLVRLIFFVIFLNNRHIN